MVGYNDEFKEKVRNANDIVDVVSQYLPLKEVEGIILEYAHSILKNLLLFLFHQIDNIFIVLVAT